MEAINVASGIFIITADIHLHVACYTGLCTHKLYKNVSSLHFDVWIINLLIKYQVIDCVVEALTAQT